jgi:transcriptional regulator with XRE-family HTH domain
MHHALHHVDALAKRLEFTHSADMDLADRVARNLRHLRAARGLTQAQAATAARLPRATWAHLESGAANPTLQVIHAAAAALGVSIEELIAAPRAAVELFPAGRLPARQKGGATVRELLPDPLPSMSLERLELPPRASFAGVPHTPGTKEYLACEAGQIVLAVGGQKHTLSAGDVLAFRGDQKHSYANPFRVVAVAYSAVVLVGAVSGFAAAARGGQGDGQAD